jgi:UDP-N-acetylglucosamine diphosphorylase/glucosamine-1-phosphate N-acetyltransferase
MAETVAALRPREALWAGDTLLAVHPDRAFTDAGLLENAAGSCKKVLFNHPFTHLVYPWHIFQYNREQLPTDFALLTQGRKSQPITDPHTRVYAAHQIFVEEGADIKAAILNAETGPIYIGKNAVVMEGAILKGSVALCEGAQVSMGAKIRPDTTLGPFAKAGGELSNVVFLGYSNKSHDGYLGNAVIGEWCNLGADTNASNLKNNYSEIRVWNYAQETYLPTGLQYCGLLMGDHSKCGINTMFNTGTVTGVGTSVFGGGFPPKFIPSFSWGGSEGLVTFELEKMLEMTRRVMGRRNMLPSPEDEEILRHVFEITKPYRKYA